MKKILIPVAVLLLAACSNSSSNKEESTVTEVTGSVPVSKTDTVEVDGITSATAVNNPVSFNGTLVIPPRNFATVSLTMGGIVKGTSLLPGDFVEKGSVLATLENPEFVDLQQTYLDSRAQLEYLEAEYKRQQVLAKEEAASQKKLQQSKADYQSMKSKVQASAAQLGMLGVNTENLEKTGIQAYLEVKAPISGYVSNVQMNLGKHIAAGEPLCEVIDKSRTLLRLVAYEKDLEDLKVGSKVAFRVNGLGKQTFLATLISIGQQVDDVNRSLEVYARVTESNPLFRPGMYITARIEKGK